MICLLACALAIVVAIEDARSRTIRNLWCVLMAALGIALQVTRIFAPHLMAYFPSEYVLDHTLPSPEVCILTAMLTLFVLVVLELVWRRLKHAPGMGMGDAKYLASCVLLAGPMLLPVSAAFTLVGALIALIRHRRDLALGPWISLALTITLTLLLA